MHVDEFIDWGIKVGESTEMERYARFFFHLHRLPAMLQADFDKFTNQYKLFCTYEGNKYRVTGCSRLGDVWLSKSFDRESGYDLRVAVEKCSDWSAI